MCHFQGCILDKRKRSGFVLEERNLGQTLCLYEQLIPERQEESVLCCPQGTPLGRISQEGGTNTPGVLQAGLGSQQG